MLDLDIKYSVANTYGNGNQPRTGDYQQGQFQFSGGLFLTHQMKRPANRAVCR